MAHRLGTQLLRPIPAKLLRPISSHLHFRRPAAVMAPTSGSRTALEEIGASGEFKRKPSVFRESIKQGGRFEPTAGRYHLYVSLACPWASRCVAALYLKGLEGAVGLSVTHPTWQRTRPDDPEDEHTGWVFRGSEDPPLASSTGHGSFPCDGCVPDPLNGAASVRDLYALANDTGGKYTVPVLWDTQEKTIVNNESSDILRMLNSEFNAFAANPGLDLYPEPLRAAIDAANESFYNSINNGVYRCGFATSQAAYDEAFKELFEALDVAEDTLSRQRYIAGDVLTEADIRLFVTLIRFDEVYVVYFKTNKKFIHEYPNLAGYTRDLYQTPGIGRSVNIDHIKRHYFTSHPRLNYYAIIPAGPGHWWEEPHGRDKQFAASA